MGRPTAEEAKRLKDQMTKLVEQGLSVNEIARKTGKAVQTVSEYLKAHGLKTVAAAAREKKTLDRDMGSSDAVARN